MSNKFDIASSMNSIISSDAHRAVFARPALPGMTKTASKKDDEDKKDDKKESGGDDAKACAAECRKIMKEMECGGTAKASGGKCVIMCDDKDAVRKCKAKCKKMGIECEVKPVKSAMNKYQACVVGLAKISETLDNAGFEKGATLALLALESLVSEAGDKAKSKKDEKKEPGKKDEKKDDKGKGKDEKKEEKGKAKDKKEDKKDKKLPPWLNKDKKDKADCGVMPKKASFPKLASPPANFEYDIINPWTKEVQTPGPTKKNPTSKSQAPVEDWMQYDPLRGLDGNFLDELDADDKPSDRNKDTRQVLDRIRGKDEDEFSFISVLSDEDGDELLSDEDGDEEGEFLDIKSVASKKSSSLLKVAADIRKKLPFLQR